MPRIDHLDISDRFSTRKLDADQTRRLEMIDGAIIAAAAALVDHGANPSRELSLAMIHLEACHAWATKSIAHEGD